MPASPPIDIVCWECERDSPQLEHEVQMLSALLHACVHAGASISFVLPYSMADARAFWCEQVLPAVRSGRRRVLVAQSSASRDEERDSASIVGTVQIDLATPPNQPHRAEIKKLLVHPAARRHGIARALMVAAEAQARADRRSLLTLDTVTGSPAERLYLRLGYVAVGVIPRYALSFDSRAWEPATFLYKELPAG